MDNKNETNRKINYNKKVTLQFINKSPNLDPVYVDEGSSGFDLRAWVDENTEGAIYDEVEKTWKVTIESLDRKLIHTGLYFEIPHGYEIQVRPRSGLALKYGITVLNSPGTIDGSYIGEVGVILFNSSKKDFEVSNGERIAQAVLSQVSNGSNTYLIRINKITKDTKRGDGGFGHTGTK